MKATKLKFIFGSCLMLLSFYSCKNEAKTEGTKAIISTSKAAESNKNGQAFIADDGSTPNVL